MSCGASCLGGLAIFCLVGSSAGAQVSGSLDLGASDIRYDLFQPSTALAISPTVAFDQGWTSVSARGTVLRFQSGHRDLHGSLVGTTFTPALGQFRLEVGADVGASKYLSFPTFAHWFGAADLHYLRPTFGAWVGGTRGTTSFAGEAGTVEVGLWGTVPWATLTVTTSHSSIGDTSYADIDAAARVNQGRVEFLGRLGDRLGGKGGGHGVYGEASLTFALNATANLVVGGGRYATDPTRGTIAGRYATLGFRLATPAPRRGDPYREVLERYLPVPSADSPVTASAEVDAARVLRVRAEGAMKIEVMGDFTDWEPVLVTDAGILLTPGPHLLEVRIDGGAWLVPLGATTVKDEFGGEAGLIVVP